MNEKITYGKGGLLATLAAATAAATALPVYAQQNTAPNNPTPPAQQGTGPSSLNPGGVQGQPPTGTQSQTVGTPTGAAAQGNSATQGSVPASNQGMQGNQQGGQMHRQRTPGNSRISVTTSNSLTGIIDRAQDMLRVADARKIDAPGGAADSYRKASQSLRQMLSAAGLGTAGSSALPAMGGSASAGRATAALSSFPLSSEQATEDIRVLRSMATQASNGRSANTGMSADQLRKLASLYATGSKEFFTGQLRDALFESPVRVAVRDSGSRVEGVVASGGTGAARVRSDRPELPFPVSITPDPQPAPQASMSVEGAAGTEGTVVEGQAPFGVDPNTVGPAPVTLPNGPVQPVAPGVFNAAPFGGAVTPNIQFAPVPGYGGYFFAPPVLIQGLYPQQFGGTFYGF